MRCAEGRCVIKSALTVEYACSIFHHSSMRDLKGRFKQKKKVKPSGKKIRASFGSSDQNLT